MKIEMQQTAVQEPRRLTGEISSVDAGHCGRSRNLREPRVQAPAGASALPCLLSTDVIQLPGSIAGEPPEQHGCHSRKFRAVNDFGSRDETGCGGNRGDLSFH
jgi:hypothetical protein